MKKFIPFIILAATLIAACGIDGRTEFKSISDDPDRTSRTYVLDTLDNGHILMYEYSNHNACCIEYPECPKCEEKLKKTITGVIDSIVRSNDELIINELSKNRTQIIHIYDE